MGREEMENGLVTSLYESLWIDGLQNQVFIRPNALPEVMNYLDSLDLNEEMQHSQYIMKTYLLQMNIFHNNHILNQENENECDEDMWNKMNNNIYPDTETIYNQLLDVFFICSSKSKQIYIPNNLKQFGVHPSMPAGI